MRSTGSLATGSARLGSEAWALNYYAAVIADTGDAGRAIAVYQDALRLAREVGHPDDEAIALQGLDEAHVHTGKSEDGADYLREALGVFRRLGMPAAEHVIRRLAEIGTLLAALTGHSQPPSFGLLIFNFETRTLSYARSAARGARSPGSWRSSQPALTTA